MSNVSFGYLNCTKYISISFLSTSTIILFPPEMTKLIFVCCNFLPFFADSVNEENQATITGMHILLDTTL